MKEWLKGREMAKQNRKGRGDEERFPPSFFVGMQEERINEKAEKGESSIASFTFSVSLFFLVCGDCFSLFFSPSLLTLFSSSPVHVVLSITVSVLSLPLVTKSK